MITETTKERPILFSGAMVRAILEGRKTQTRRAVKPQPSGGFTPSPAETYYPIVTTKGYEEPGQPVFGCYDAHGWNEGRTSPYGKPGDQLWVRETWGTNGRWDDVKPSALPSGDLKPEIHYRADCSGPNAYVDGQDRWRPVIHMPRWVSRITLEIESVRVERLHEITEADAKAEGADAPISRKVHGWTPHVLGFAELWNSINAEREGGKYAWAANPWVWVIGFRRVNAKESE